MEDFCANVLKLEISALEHSDTISGLTLNENITIHCINCTQQSTYKNLPKIQLLTFHVLYHNLIYGVLRAR